MCPLVCKVKEKGLLWSSHCPPLLSCTAVECGPLPTDSLHVEMLRSGEFGDLRNEHVMPPSVWYISNVYPVAILCERKNLLRFYISPKMSQIVPWETEFNSFQLPMQGCSLPETLRALLIISKDNKERIPILPRSIPKSMFFEDSDAFLNVGSLLPSILKQL